MLTECHSITGGTAGCVIASRLSDADPTLSILLVEGGRDNYLVPFVTHPLLWQGSYNPADPWNLNYKANKEDQLLGRQSSVDAGGSLGGGSSLNLMMYSRPQRCDYDSWNTKGWSTDDLLPFMKRVRTQNICLVLNNIIDLNLYDSSKLTTH